MKLLLIVRNKLASLAGLDTPTASEILHVEVRDRYHVGGKIGVWPIFSLCEDEIIAGRNNKHMDFRLSVLKVPDGEGTSVVVSTVCTVHNLAGRLYLFFVAPFHRFGVRKLLVNALAAPEVVMRFRRCSALHLRSSARVSCPFFQDRRHQNT
jgi:hypothetical protein